jgi:hypothetical protein
MKNLDPSQTYATSLLTDVMAAPENLPRRHVLAEWLRDFLLKPRMSSPEGILWANGNLRAIDAHLLDFEVPLSARPALA